MAGDQPVRGSVDPLAPGRARPAAARRTVPAGHRVLRPAGAGGARRALVVCLRGTEARDRAEREHADLIATVAHELRSPLTGIKGFTATLLAKWDRFTEDQRRLMLEAVDSDADRLTRLIAELLDVARIDAGRLELRRVPTDLAALVRKRVEAKTVAGVDADRFAVDIADDLPEVWVDPDKMGQVLDNLIENALRHGDGTITVTVRQDPDGLVMSRGRPGAGHPAGAGAPHLRPLLEGVGPWRDRPRPVRGRTASSRATAVGSPWSLRRRAAHVSSSCSRSGTPRADRTTRLARASQPPSPLSRRSPHACPPPTRRSTRSR